MSASFQFFDTMVETLTLDGEPQAQDIFDIMDPGYIDENISFEFPDAIDHFNALPLIVAITIGMSPMFFIALELAIFAWVFFIGSSEFIIWAYKKRKNPESVPNKFVLTDHLLIALLRYDGKAGDYQSRIPIDYNKITEIRFTNTQWKRKMIIDHEADHVDYIATFRAPLFKNDVGFEWEQLFEGIRKRLPSGANVIRK